MKLELPHVPQLALIKPRLLAGFELKDYPRLRSVISHPTDQDPNLVMVSDRAVSLTYADAFNSHAVLYVIAFVPAIFDRGSGKPPQKLKKPDMLGIKIVAWNEDLTKRIIDTSRILATFKPYDRSNRALTFTIARPKSTLWQLNEFLKFLFTPDVRDMLALEAKHRLETIVAKTTL